MTTPIDFHTASATSTSITPPANQGDGGVLQALGAELAFIQDGAGQYHAFYWQDALRYGLSLAEVVGRTMEETFAPVDVTLYLERVRQVLDDARPTLFRCQFTDGELFFDFELTLSPILRGETISTLLVMGRQVSVDRPESNLPRVDEYYPTSTSQTPAAAVESPDAIARPIDRRADILFPSQVAQNIRHAVDLETIWQQAVWGLGSSLDVTRCSICSYNPGDPSIAVMEEYIIEGMKSWRGRKFDLKECPEIQNVLTRLDLVESSAIATVTLGDLCGTIALTSDRGKPNSVLLLFRGDFDAPWNPHELETIAEIADLVGAAIAHATLYRELEEARQAAEEVSRLKSNFLANTSHELRTPLNGILGFLKLIVDGMADDPEEQMEFIEEAYRSAEHLLNIINDILDIAKIESGKMQLDLEPVVLAEILDHLKSFALAQVQQKNLYFQIHVPPTDDEVILFCNYQRLLQVLLNLVGNAIKFTHEGGITIAAEIIKKKVRFQNQEFAGSVRIQVADTGIGVSLDRQDKLFQSFSQIDGSRTRQYGGTGLGLVISQKLVESMGGVVHFYSMGDGLGATVTFTIPLYQAPVMVSDDIDSLCLLMDSED
ncbi:histidine kinase [Oscillatoriales cyanobacterium LEGE 11467]|uniref:Circadian input-output histidine kinase CikA n=1 Tax=Zarconia navalis LEGE 11467 TaxID=1828826 RepID=A0A928VY85_9CYAN|nr:ATP-binding protein [Zarconia navalis]MBE9041478.1 histidine kinase [Zarconia navalis LEGE 11467]